VWGMWILEPLVGARAVVLCVGGGKVRESPYMSGKNKYGVGLNAHTIIKGVISQKGVNGGMLI